MRFHAEVFHGGMVVTDTFDGLPDLAAAKSDALSLLTQVIRIGCDGLGRTASIRITGGDNGPASTMSLTLDVRDD